MANAAEALSPQQLKALLDTGNPPLLLDIRGKSAYRSGSILGALNIGQDPQGFLPNVDAEVIVLIEPQPRDELLLRAWIERLTTFDRKVYTLSGGFPAWQATGLPTGKMLDNYVLPGTVPFHVPRGLCEMNEPAQIFE